MQVCYAFGRQWKRLSKQTPCPFVAGHWTGASLRDFKTSFLWSRTTYPKAPLLICNQKIIAFLFYEISIICFAFPYMLCMYGVNRKDGPQSSSKQPGTKGGHRPADKYFVKRCFFPRLLCIRLCCFVFLDNCVAQNAGQLSPGRCVLSASRSAWPYLAAPLWNVLVWDSTDQHDFRKLCVLSQAGHGNNWAPKWPRTYVIPSVVKKYPFSCEKNSVSVCSNWYVRFSTIYLAPGCTTVVSCDFALQHRGQARRITKFSPGWILFEPPH